jgi:MFS family permease
MAHDGTPAGTVSRRAAARPTAIAPEAPPEAPSDRQPYGLAATFRSLRHRNYRLYFIGQLVSLTGTWMQSTALMWVAFEITGQSMWTGWVGASQLLPTFFFGAWGGALADRLPKRTVLFATQAAQLILALVLAALVFTDRLNPWLLLAITTANGLVIAVDLPARLAFVMEMAGREDLMNAVALNSLFFNVARAIGPAVAGWLLKFLGPGLCFVANAVSFLAVLWALAEMTVGLTPVARPGTRRHSLAAGILYLGARPGLALLVVVAGALSISGWPFLTLLPALASKVLSVREEGYSLMLSATGCGALAAALAVAAFGSMSRHRLLTGMGVCMVAAGLFALSATQSLVPAIVYCAIVGAGLVLFFATSQAVVQLRSRDQNRGLIMGIWAMVISGGLPLGNLLAGPAADQWGEPLVLRVLGLASGAAAAALLLLFYFWEHAGEEPDLTPEPHTANLAASE